MADQSSVETSAYLLEFSIPPGTVRRGDVHAFGDIAGVFQCLRQSFIDAPSVLRAHEAFLALCHDESILLWAVDHGEITRCVNVRRFLSVFIGNTQCISLLATDEYVAASKRLGFGLIRSAGAIFQIDEAGLFNAIGTVRAPSLTAGTTLAVRDADLLYTRPTCLGAGEVLQYGKNDLEHDMLMGRDQFTAGLVRLGAARKERGQQARA